MAHKLSTFLSLKPSLSYAYCRRIFLYIYDKKHLQKYYGISLAACCVCYLEFTQINGINLIQPFRLRFHSISFGNAIFMIRFRFSSISMFRCHQYKERREKKDCGLFAQKIRINTTISKIRSNIIAISKIKIYDDLLNILCHINRHRCYLT